MNKQVTSKQTPDHPWNNWEWDEREQKPKKSVNVNKESRRHQINNSIPVKQQQSKTRFWYKKHKNEKFNFIFNELFIVIAKRKKHFTSLHFTLIINFIVNVNIYYECDILLLTFLLIWWTFCLFCSVTFAKYFLLTFLFDRLFVWLRVVISLGFVGKLGELLLLCLYDFPLLVYDFICKAMVF